MDNSFNHDRFNTWKKCKTKYYYKYIKKLAWPEFSNDYKTGKEIHALADYYLRGQDIEHLLANASDDVLVLWKKLKASKLLEYKIIATEWSFNTKIGQSSFWLNGRIDAIFYHEKTNKYIIVDWKTGENIAKHTLESYQHLVYLYALCYSCKDLDIDVTPDNVEFQYVQLAGNTDTIVYDYSQEKQSNNEKEFLNIIKEVENYKFSTSNNCNDNYCNYKQLCQG